MTNSKKNQELIDKVNTRLIEGLTWEQISEEVNIPLPTLYSKIRRLGYTTGKRLVPIHAPELTNK